MSFHILKSLHNSLIFNATSYIFFNATSYIFFNIHNQAIIYLLISHSIAQFILYIYHCWKIINCCLA